jgi:hypothetical protein
LLGQRALIDGAVAHDQDGEALSAKWLCVDTERGATLTPQPGLKAEFPARQELPRMQADFGSRFPVRN